MSAVAEWKVLSPTGETIRSRQIEAARARRQYLSSAYVGANRGRFFADWEAPTGDADTTLIPERMILIARTRERARNDMAMRGIMKKIVNAVVGPTGFRLTADLNYERLGISAQQASDIEAAIDRECESWCAEADYSGSAARRMTLRQMHDLIYRSELETGEALIIPRWISRAGHKWRFCLQILETDRIVNPFSARTGLGGIYRIPETSEYIVDGVHIGTRGEVKGIYLATEHPGRSQWGRMPYETRYIPAVNRKTGRPNFWLRSVCYRPEAVRGEPGFAASLAGFRRIGEFVGSQLQLAQLCADRGIIMETPEAPDEEAIGLLDADKYGSEGEKEQPQMWMDPYSIEFAPPGTKPHVIGTDTPGPQFDAFVTRMVGMIGNAHGLHYEQANGDLRGMTWATAKASDGQTRRGQEKEQKRFIEDYCVIPREYVIEEAWLAGRLDLPGFENPELRSEYFRHVAYASQWPDLQPVDEETAAKMRIENGVSNEYMECARRGVDFDTVVAGRAAAKAAYEAAGLELPAWYRDPTPPVMPGVAADGDETEEESQDE